MTIPGSPVDLDAAWLESTLRAGAFPAARVRGVRTEVIGVGFGLDGTLARLTLDAADAPLTLVAKWCGAKEAAVEARFYRRLAPRLDVPLARLHADALDDAGVGGLLLLEDVAPAKQGDVLVGPTEAESGALADAMASFHAAYWDRGGDADVAPMRDWLADKDPRVGRLCGNLPRFLDEWRDRLPDDALALAANLPNRLPAAHAALADAPVTLVHSDLHLDNVLFREGGAAVVLDWTDAARGPAAVDVARLFVECDPAPRRARQDALFARYARAVAARGVVGCGEDRLRRDTERVALFLFAAAIRWAAGPDPLVPAPRVPRIVELCVRNAAAVCVEGFS